MKYDVLGYVFKIWCTTSFISPLFTVFLLLAGNDIRDSFSMYLMAFIMGGFFSIPAVGIFWLLCKSLVYRIENKSIIKLILAPVSAVLIYVEFLAVNNFDFNMNSFILGLCIAYSVVTLACTLIYRIKVLGVDEDECDPGMMN
jgi:hypothetical protein